MSSNQQEFEITEDGFSVVYIAGYSECPGAGRQLSFYREEALGVFFGEKNPLWVI